jgi:hypothetical protein
MTKVTARRASTTIGFRAQLQRPKAARPVTWTFLVLPGAASAKLRTRSAMTVEGALNGQAFRAVIEPDGRKSHWLKVTNKLREAAGARVGEMVHLEIVPAAQEMETRPPADLRDALRADARAHAVWQDITPAARRDWILWVLSARQAATRERRIRNACDMLGKGKRRVCCFDRSGFYSQALGAPEAADH